MCLKNLSLLHIQTILSFGEIWTSVVNPLTVSPSFISISFYLMNHCKKAFGGVRSSPPGWARANRSQPNYNSQGIKLLDLTAACNRLNVNAV